MSPSVGSAILESPVFPLIGPQELAAVLDRDRPPVVLDVRWSLAGADEPGYLVGHIPGARFVDLDARLAGPPGPGGRHPLPEPDELQRFWRSVGIDNGSAVVVYDGSDSSPAARAWWLLRWSGISEARVLDGGLAGWLAAGLPVADGPEPAPLEGSMTLRPGGMPTVEADDVASSTDGSLVLLDARAAARFRGEVEPVDPVAGHIPGAVSLPYAQLLDERRRFRPAQELTAAFEQAGVVAPGTAGVTGKPTAAASCGSGVTACMLVLAAATIGLELALYPGSYSQWCALGREVATGD